MNVLHVCADPKPTEDSVSKQLSTAFIGALVENCPDVELNNIDLYQDVPSFVSNEFYRAVWKDEFEPGYQPTAREQKTAEYARLHAALFNDADVLVLSMPMWHFSVPGIMKAWLDQVLAPGLTFDLNPEGVTPLHRLRRVVLLVSSGDIYKEDDPRDALTPLIRAAFDFVRVQDIAVAWADGQTAMFHGDHAERKALAMEAAQEEAEDIAAAAATWPPREPRAADAAAESGD
jgi:FMN-dependent NADH-azoreductase